MARVIIVGDGPGGLSAALFLAKNDQQVHVYGQDKTAMNFAHLHNYLGIDEIAGTEFQQRARAQVIAMGAHIHSTEVLALKAEDQQFTANLGSETSVIADYLVLSEGKAPELARSLGLAHDASGAIAVDSEGRSSLDKVYVIGRSARPNRSQAIISAGDGAKAALDILSREAGKDVQDWDTPPKD